MDETATIQVSFNNRSIHNCIIKGKPAKRWNELMRIKNMIPKERHEEYIKKNPEIKHMLPKGCLCNETWFCGKCYEVVQKKKERILSDKR
jgi:hypothetical protein